MSTPRPYFVVSCARSGSTSLARILGGPEGSECAIEPAPNLNRETRLATDGRIEDLRRVVEERVVPRVAAEAPKHKAYGEKDVTYGPFLPTLHELLGCRFVYLTRDGRDVVRSLLDWHDRMFGSIYRECCEAGNPSPRALAAAASLPADRDTSDYSRPRPLPGDPWFHAWNSMSRAEMCTWYWMRINSLYLKALQEIPEADWRRLDYSSVTADDLLDLAAFLEVDGLTRDGVEALLGARINSLRDRCDEEARQLDWRAWDGGRRRRFEAIGGDMMERLGYWGDPSTRWRPAGFGEFWSTHGSDLEWFEWMFDSRRTVHEECLAWIKARRDAGNPMDSVMDLGCGLGVGYAKALEGRRYVGVDLDADNIAWCRENRKAPTHEFLCRDFVADPVTPSASLVISHGTIDNCYDADAFLASAVGSSHGWIYLTCYRGWFPHLDEHRYTWNPEHGCFYNDLSPARLEESLRMLGCHDITVEPIATDNPDTRLETRVLARVPDRRAS